MPKLHLETLQFDPATIHNLIRLSRIIVKNNRNQTWNTGISVIADAVSPVYQTLENMYGGFNPKRDGIDHTSVGTCWRRRGDSAIWISPFVTRGYQTGNLRDPVQVAITMCHEVAHALTNTGHDRTWRGAFALLLPFWLHRLANVRDCDILVKVNDTVRWITDRYATRSGYLDQRVESIRNTTRAMAGWEKYQKLYTSMM